MKIAIVMAYHQRNRQLAKTLDSFCRYNPDDFNVIVVDDNSPDDIVIGEYPFKVTIIKLRTKNWVCCPPVFNTGFIEALKDIPDAIIIQNPESYHNGDIIGYIKENLTDSNYLSFGCYALNKDEDVDIKNLREGRVEVTGGSGWYNHSVYCPVAFHFCNAITRSNLIKLNGFDERFASGLGFDDNYLVHQVRCLGLQIKIVDNPYVFHQYHYDVKSFNFDGDLYNRSGELYNELSKGTEYRAEHSITPDL